MNNPALRYTRRLFGIRNVALGLQVWGARNDPDRLAQLAGQNAAVELTDMVAARRCWPATRPAQTGRGVMATSISVTAGFLTLRASQDRTNRHAA